MEQDFNTCDECKFFNSTAKWRYTSRQMGALVGDFKKIYGYKTNTRNNQDLETTKIIGP
jgi:hypothetical protein